MSYISYVSDEAADEPTRATFAQLKQQYGAVANIFRAFAHNPAMLSGFLALNGAMKSNALDPKLFELAYLKASELNHCDYCLAHHRSSGRKAGLTREQVQELADFETSPAYDDLQREVLRYAESVTRTCEVDPALMDRLHQRLSDREIIELAMAVGLANLTNRVTGTLKMELP